ncbi:erythroblast NAD(P)(+)--arginine ADP-ribosyltransferase-like [Poecilia reticulata]|uniref:erythroblast NAD(P)(+)--arginine ADP-ribosyltransferase-like n=1 Tax=Poecilia reticulata TaxID=8081 RepID=UPI0007E9BEC1|nr:PREDICTED: erythroblast NAD(P)(+)--arginine ADP-ribosyltransferase-like [Poecilia reticulata]
MVIFASLCLLWWVQFNGVRSVIIPLEFHEESIDDMYSKCKDEMAKMLFDKYSKELTKEGYGTHWDNEKSKIKKDNILTQQELQAIRVYTEHENGVYNEFSVAVRTGKNMYGTSFKFHILYYLLASALQKLKIADKNKCHTAYRRNSVPFKQMAYKMRFGSFASSSLTHNQTTYGTETCFKIKTCYGAVIEEYSAHPEEKEVLIPPYEIFKIIKSKDVAELQDCKTVFVLTSDGTKSNLDHRLIR